MSTRASRERRPFSCACAYSSKVALAVCSRVNWDNVDAPVASIYTQISEFMPTLIQLLMFTLLESYVYSVKVGEQCFAVTLFIVLYQKVLTVESMDEILKCDHSNKSYKEYVAVALFIVLYQKVLTVESMDEILKCDHSNESYKEYVAVALFIVLYQKVLTVESTDEILKCDHSNESYKECFAVALLLCCTRRFLLLSLWMKS